MGPAAGRLTAFAIDPTNANTMYAGFALGGVWKSIDGGASWTVLTDTQASLAVGALVLDANDPSTLYVGTGEGNYSGDSFFGQGILKSTNGGASFVVVAGDTFRGFSGARLFSDPSGPLYVGTVQGVSGAGASCVTHPLRRSLRGRSQSTAGRPHSTPILPCAPG